MSRPTVSQVRTWLLCGYTMTDAAAGIEGVVDIFDGELISISRNYWDAMDSWRGDTATASSPRRKSGCWHGDAAADRDGERLTLGRRPHIVTDYPQAQHGRLPTDDLPLFR